MAAEGQPQTTQSREKKGAISAEGICGKMSYVTQLSRKNSRMGRQISQNRLLCRDCHVTHPTSEEVQTRDCWVGRSCQQYRSRLRNRDKENRRRRKVEEPVAIANVPAEVLPIAVVHLYRLPRVDSPLHAFMVEVWSKGEKMFQVGPTHTVGMSAKQIQQAFDYAFQLLKAKFGIRYFDEGSMLTHPISDCPVEGCPCREK